MKRYRRRSFVFILFALMAGIFVTAREISTDDDRFVSCIVDPSKEEIRIFWQDEKSENFGSIQKLKDWLAAQNKQLVFAMNGGMYKSDGSPQGLYIAHGKILAPLDTTSGVGNFYLKPNGVFYITKDNKAAVCKTGDYKQNVQVNYATQSGPMLVIDGNINPAFKEGSSNLNVRNGVGVLPGNKIVFAMSKKEITFYDFANYFKRIGCKNALYLDGFVSRTYLPVKNWKQTDGDFGVIIAVVK